MKAIINEETSLTRQQKQSIIRLLNYSFEDINSYEELTDTERTLIDKETFNSLFQ